jgi:hypothetical protein
MTTWPVPYLKTRPTKPRRRSITGVGVGFGSGVHGVSHVSARPSVLAVYSSLADPTSTTR